MAFIPIDSDDKLWLRCENTVAPTTFIDGAMSPHTITTVGNAVQLPTKFNVSAGFFDGSNDNVAISDDASFDFSTGNFTLEMFVMFNTVATACLLDRNTGGLQLYYVGGKLYFYAQGTNFYVNWTPTANTWYHIMAVRSGLGATDSAIYINGVSAGTGQLTGDISGTAAIYLGSAATGAPYFHGWMKELRISNIARTASVPTTQYPTDINTIVLCHFNTTQATPLDTPASFIDEMGKTMIPSGAKIDWFAIGDGVGYFDGTGDYLTIPTSTDFDIPGDYTVEFWVRFNVVADPTSFIDRNSGAFNIQYAGGNLHVILTTDQTFAWTPAINTWYHVAVSRVSGSVKAFIDGTQIGTTQTNNNTLSASATLYIGANEGGPSQYHNGIIDNLRFTKGVGRYTSNFTPAIDGGGGGSSVNAYSMFMVV